MNMILTHETLGRQHRIIAICHKRGWRSLAYNPAESRATNHLIVARKLADALGASVHYGEHGKLSDEGGIFHMAGQHTVVLTNSDIPPNARKVRHRHSSAIAYFWQADAAWHVVVTAMFRDTIWATVSDMSDIERFVTSEFEATKASEAQAKIADLQARIANAPTFIPMDTDGLADEPDTDDTSAMEPATGRQDAPGVLVAESPGNAVLSDPVAMPLRISASRKRGTVITLRPKALNGAAFFELAQAAKNAARGALGDYWYLKPGQSLHLDIPARYRSFRTAIGTKIKLSGDRRYPAAEYWPTGQFPALVSPIADYAWDTSARMPEPYRGSGASGHGKPEPLMLFPEIEIEDDRDESEPDDLREAA